MTVTRRARHAAPLRASAERWRTTAADQGSRHPRQLVLAVAVTGLLLGIRAPASVIAVSALLVAFGALTVPVVRRPAAALALAAILLASAWVADARTAALERTHLTATFGQTVNGEATLLAPLRADAYGGRRALVRWRGEPVLLRVPAWLVDGAGDEATPGAASGGAAAIARGGAATRGSPPDALHVGDLLRVNGSTRGSPPDALRVGDLLRVRGTLRPPDLAGRAVHAHATLRATALTPTGRRRGGALGVVDGVRRRAERVLDGHLPTAEAALLRGMVLGDDAAMPGDVHDAFVAAGLSHLTAASGQNVALLAALALGLCAVAGLGIRARWALVLLLIALYVPLAGGGPSIQRAGVMGAATIAAALAGRPASRWHALLLAAAATLVLDPRSAADAGWQLSFAAVIGIATIAAPARERLRRRGLAAPVAEAVAVTLAATLATAPLIAVHFDRASLVALPANVLAAPAVAPVMWLGLAAAALGQLTPTLAAPLVALTGPPLGYLAGLARLAAKLPAAQAALPLSAIVVLCALGAVLLTAPLDHDRAPGGRSTRRRAALALALLLTLAAALGPALVPPRTLAPPPEGDLRVTALDIGQGDATLLQAGGHAILVDAGPAGDGVAAKLRRAGVRRLDALVVTHPQADHDGGAPAVLAAVPTTMLLDGRGGDRAPSSTAIDAPARARDARHRRAGGPGRPRRAAVPAGPLAAGRARRARDRPERPRGRRRRGRVRRHRAAYRRRRVAGPRAARPAAGRRPEGQPPRQRRPGAARAAGPPPAPCRADRGRRPQHLRPPDAVDPPGPRRRRADRPAHRPRRRRAGRPARGPRERRARLSDDRDPTYTDRRWPPGSPRTSSTATTTGGSPSAAPACGRAPRPRAARTGSRSSRATRRRPRRSASRSTP